MECLAVSKLPSGSDWVYEIKLDGYRALAINSNDKLSLYSRRRKSFNRQYQHVFEALRDLPQNTVVDGEIVALDDLGRPDFNLLQHSRNQASRICYFVFDLLVYDSRDLIQLPLIERREILRSRVKFESSRIVIAEYFEASVDTMLQSAREQGLEGVVAKRKNSRYEPGKRTGAWAKYRLNTGQELVIGGYVPGVHGVEAVIVGFYRESKLIYVARVRNGFVQLTRRQVFARLQPLAIPECPFTNLPEKERGRWGTGLTAEDMKKCVWVRPEIVARIEYLEWTDGDHLRHAKFAGLRADKDARSVTKEHAGEA
jgi:bifunctional non-homologous end joining protein LigD